MGPPRKVSSFLTCLALLTASLFSCTDGRIRLDADGDDGGGGGGGPNGVVRAIALPVPEPGIFIGGDFTEFSGTSVGRIARVTIDGALDPGFAPSRGFEGGEVRDLRLDAGTIYVAGAFNKYDSELREGLARIHTTGPLDTDFTLPNGGFDLPVNAVDIGSEDDVYVGGEFTEYGGVVRSRVAKLSDGGTLETLWVPPGFDEPILDLKFLGAWGEIAVVGKFEVPEQFVYVLSTFDASTSFAPTLVALDDIAHAVVESTSGFFVVGKFVKYQGTPSPGKIDLLRDGGAVGIFHQTVNGSVYAAAKDFAGTGYYLGGDFTSYDGTNQNRIVHIDASGDVDPLWDSGTGLDGTVHAIAIDPVRFHVYVGGDFDEYDGNPSPNLVRLNQNGVFDTGFVF